MEEEGKPVGAISVFNQQHFSIGANTKEARAKRICIGNACI